ncbi:MAG: hypothetical protein H7A23_11360 [Leptospiraceae bacterium]|nr:hypothetical protein [Leptospiraceae bacterium]MCP5495143.1 hypothetical protein [Leptospiraceae bacterium]
MDKIIYDPDFAVVIKAYRQSLIQRYSRENISKYKEFSRIKQETIDKLTTYFLELLYPEYEVRLKLDNAFDSLAGFVNSPSKFLGLLGNIGYAIFKFGRHLTSAIRAGMAALSSYLVAHKFERDLLINGKEMIRQGIDITQETNFELLVSKIPKEEADKFRKDIVKLFSTLSNTELLEKIIEIMDHIIIKMKKKPNVYTPSEVEGIKMGMDIINQGKEVFYELSHEEVVIIIQGIDIIEKDYFYDIMRKHKINPKH